MTVCRIKRNDAESRFEALYSSQTLGTSASPITKPDDEVELVDLDASIRDQIRARILQRFKGHGLARLVASVLRTQGFTTETAKEGPDGGVDIFAAMGNLGFGSPRMVVQVKSEQGQIDVAAVRELQGVMHQNQADNGLFVAWGGYRGSVRKEFARSFFQIRLWSSEDLIDALMENYDQLDPDIRQEIPLKRVWMLNLPEL